MSEAQLQSAVLDLAQLLGWKCAHFRPAQTQTGRWVTPVAADGVGFPDLVMVRGGTIVFAELKSARGRVSLSQEMWLSELAHCSQSTVITCVWRPADWLSGEVEAVLRGTA